MLEGLRQEDQVPPDLQPTLHKSSQVLAVDAVLLPAVSSSGRAQVPTHPTWAPGVVVHALLYPQVIMVGPKKLNPVK